MPLSIDQVSEKLNDSKEKINQTITHIVEKRGVDMTSVLVGVICVLTGALGTGGTIWAIQNKNKDKTAEYTQLITAIGGIKSDVAAAQLVTTENVTDISLLEVPCSAEYIDKSETGDLLCREMYCLLQNRGLDASTSQAQCEEISNLKNSLVILDACEGLAPEPYRACLAIFSQRK